MSKILFVVFCVTLCISCKDKNNEPAIETVEVSTKNEVHTSAPLEATFEDDQIAAIYTAYNSVKTALVNTDAKTTAAAAEKLVAAYTAKGVDAAVVVPAQTMATASNIEEQRKAFEIVTKDIEIVLEGAISSGAIYKQYCPMAFNNKGAYWLSNTKEIRNPYFGDVMLKCGRVAQEIK